MESMTPDRDDETPAASPTARKPWVTPRIILSDARRSEGGPTFASPDNATFPSLFTPS